MDVNVNNKILWVCFWQQYIANIMWIDRDRIFSENLMTTIKWVGQFWLMPFEFDKNVANVPYIYRGLVDALSNHWQNKWFTWVLTRTWHVDFNLLNSVTVNSRSVVPIVNDTMTWSPIIWWTTNKNILWNQAHLEINLFEDLYTLQKEVNNLIPALEATYWKKIINILDNVSLSKNITNSMGDIFYISALNELSSWIISKYKYVQKSAWTDLQASSLYIWDSLKFKDLVWEKVSVFNFREPVSTEDVVRKLDESKKLKMLTNLDWKVNRWITEIWKTLWLWDIWWLINEHKQFIDTLPVCVEWKWEWHSDIRSLSIYKPYIFRDYWAWNWKLVKEVDLMDWVHWYWVWDYAYFDIYEWIWNHKEFKDIPVNVIKVLVQELFENFQADDDKNYPELIAEALDKISFQTRLISNSSMFSSKTDMFNDSFVELTKDDLDYIENNPIRLNEIKDFIKNNFYELVEWYFHKLMISDFTSLYINDNHLKQSDFQTAIRSTSHVDGPQLEKILYDYVMYNSKPWSIYFDNWVVRSYSSVPRIREYINLKNKFNNIRIYFTYDTRSNYISSAVILKEPYMNKDIIVNHLDDWVILLDADELYENSFFRIERFYRELIILSFKTYTVFYDKNKDIVEFLKFLSKEIKNMNNTNIKKVILIGINNLIHNINKESWEQYSKLSSKDLDFYISKTDPSVRKILDWDIFIQDWFNTDFNRNN